MNKEQVEKLNKEFEETIRKHIKFLKHIEQCIPESNIVSGEWSSIFDVIGTIHQIEMFLRTYGSKTLGNDNLLKELSEK